MLQEVFTEALESSGKDPLERIASRKGRPTLILHGWTDQSLGGHAVSFVVKDSRIVICNAGAESNGKVIVSRTRRWFQRFSKDLFSNLESREQYLDVLKKIEQITTVTKEDQRLERFHSIQQQRTGNCVLMSKVAAAYAILFLTERSLETVIESFSSYVGSVVRHAEKEYGARFKEIIDPK